MTYGDAPRGVFDLEGHRVSSSAYQFVLPFDVTTRVLGLVVRPGVDVRLLSLRRTRPVGDELLIQHPTPASDFSWTNQYLTGLRDYPVLRGVVRSGERGSVVDRVADIVLLETEPVRDHPRNHLRPRLRLQQVDDLADESAS